MLVTDPQAIATLPRSHRQDLLLDDALIAKLRVQWYDLAEGGCTLTVLGPEGASLKAMAYRNPRTGRINHYTSVGDANARQTITLTKAHETIGAWIARQQGAS